MATHKVVKHDEWLAARKKHLVRVSTVFDGVAVTHGDGMRGARG